MSRKVRTFLILCCIQVFLAQVVPKDCTKAQDVVLVVDSGPDVTGSNWKLVANLTNDLSNQLNPSEFGTHVALVQYAGNVTIVHGLRTELSFNTSVTYFQNGRNLANGIYTTRRLVLDNRDGDRPEVSDVIVVISHAPSDDSIDAITEANEVKSEGIRIVTVGVTNAQVDELKQELKEIATNPNDIDHLMLISPNYYQSVLSFLVHAVCRNEPEAANESLRLADGTSNTGRLEVYVNEEWLTVCSTGWKSINTEIACKELGFPDGQAMYSKNHTLYYRRVAVDNIQCTGNESKLLDCPHNPLFHIDSSCDHRNDVFLQCLCGNCDGEYNPQVNVRLEDREWAISGRLEVFSPELRWGGVCSHDWTSANTRVACRQVGFLDGAGTLESNSNLSVPLVLFNVSCSGSELSLFDCRYTTIMPSEDCADPVYIQCECHRCPQFVLKAPQQHSATTQSIRSFRWHLSHSITSFNIGFLSQKNFQALVRVTEGKIAREHTRFQDRIKLINDDNTQIGFSLTNITAADMGTYALSVPHVLFDSQAVLIVTDFAVVPNPVFNRTINESIQLSWDFTPLRRVGEISYEILLTTPATGRVPIEFYYDHWLKDNPGRHAIPQTIDYLHPTVIIEEVTKKNEGSYDIKVKVTSPVYQWIEAYWQYSTDLRVVVMDHIIDLPKHSSTPTAVIVLSTLFALSVVANVLCTVLICWCYWRKRITDEENDRLVNAQELHNVSDRRQQRDPMTQESSSYTSGQYYSNTNDIGDPARRAQVSPVPPATPPESPPPVPARPSRIGNVERDEYIYIDLPQDMMVCGSINDDCTENNDDTATYHTVIYATPAGVERELNAEDEYTNYPRYLQSREPNTESQSHAMRSFNGQSGGVYGTLVKQVQSSSVAGETSNENDFGQTAKHEHPQSSIHRESTAREIDEDEDEDETEPKQLQTSSKKPRRHDTVYYDCNEY